MCDVYDTDTNCNRFMDERAFFLSNSSMRVDSSIQLIKLLLFYFLVGKQLCLKENVNNAIYNQ